MRHKIFAISDLHLGLGIQKTMDKFGKNWKNHHIKIKENWLSDIRGCDYVLICGDISWAMKLNAALPDLDFISELPGVKIFIKGNHDYWWDKTAKLNGLYDSMIFLSGNYFAIGDCAICGTRGWLSPMDKFFVNQDKKIYERELGRLEASLKSAARDGMNKIMLMLHFPIFNDERAMEIMSNYPVVKVVYGHLHGDDARMAINGEYCGMELSLVSADFLNFKPSLISEQTLT